MSMERIGNRLDEVNDSLRGLPIGATCTHFAGMRLEVTGSEPFGDHIAMLEQRIADLNGPCLNNSSVIDSQTSGIYSALEQTDSNNPHIAGAKVAARGLLVHLNEHDKAAGNMINLAERIIACLREAGELVGYYHDSHTDALKNLEATGGKRDKISSEAKAYMSEIGLA